MFFTLFLFIVIVMATSLLLNKPSFGRHPRGERLERIEKSINYREGKFHNRSNTPQLTSDKSFLSNVAGFIFRRNKGLRPETEIPVVITDLKNIPANENIAVWLGHGSYLLQIEGKRILVDPVFYSASPVAFFNKAFKSSYTYRITDMPQIDYLIISHDHWDHLDYRTAKELRRQLLRVICPLGVGEHFEYWGYDNERIIEMDWDEQTHLDSGIVVHCLPARHFSGRGLKPNRTLWASFLIETSERNIFLGGDGGYDSHFSQIGKRFDPINFAVIENGQYNEDWSLIHLMPEKLVRAITDLAPEKVMTVHNSKYALSKHPWDEPLKNISEANLGPTRLLTPAIGEIIRLDDPSQQFERWWEGLR